MIFSGLNVACVLAIGCAAAAYTTPYDGISAVEVDDRGMVNSLMGRRLLIHDTIGCLSAVYVDGREVA